MRRPGKCRKDRARELAKDSAMTRPAGVVEQQAVSQQAGEVKGENETKAVAVDANSQQAAEAVAATVYANSKQSPMAQQGETVTVDASNQQLPMTQQATATNAVTPAAETQLSNGITQVEAPQQQPWWHQVNSEASEWLQRSQQVRQAATGSLGHQQASAATVNDNETTTDGPEDRGQRVCQQVIQSVFACVASKNGLPSRMSYPG